MKMRSLQSGCLMKFFTLVFTLTSSLLVASLSAETNSVRLIGIAEFAGDASDRSGFSGRLDDGHPEDQLGGFSAIEYLGNDEYLLLPDRGPGDGACHYQCRFHKVRLAISVDEQLEYELLQTKPLNHFNGAQLTGFAADFDPKNSHNSLRFDAEGIRRLSNGRLIISDEYGPTICVFDGNGKCLDKFDVPDHVKAMIPNADPKREANENRSGRQPNGGIECLAITPSGKKIFAIMQRPLIQDSGPANDENSDREGQYCRILQFDSKGNLQKEFAYPLDYPVACLSEAVAFDETHLIVIERDSKTFDKSLIKRLYIADLGSASDIKRLPVLPIAGNLTNAKPIEKELLIDFLEVSCGLKEQQVARKIEGLAFGPTLPGGERTLVVATDNDFFNEEPSRLYVFAIKPERLPNYGWNW